MIYTMAFKTLILMLAFLTVQPVKSMSTSENGAKKQLPDLFYYHLHRFEPKETENEFGFEVFNPDDNKVSAVGFFDFTKPNNGIIWFTPLGSLQPRGYSSNPKFAKVFDVPTIPCTNRFLAVTANVIKSATTPNDEESRQILVEQLHTIATDLEGDGTLDQNVQGIEDLTKLFQSYLDYRVEDLQKQLYQKQQYKKQLKLRYEESSTLPHLPDLYANIAMIESLEPVTEYSDWQRKSSIRKFLNYE